MNGAVNMHQASERIARLQEAMTREGIHAAMILYSRDLLYYTGTTQPSTLLVTPCQYRLLVRAGLEFAREETWLDEKALSQGGGHEETGALLTEWGGFGGRMGLEMDLLPAVEYLRISRAFPQFHITNISPLILDQRMVKDDEEIACIREACRILHKGHERLLKVFREGMTELEISSEIEAAHRLHGHEGEYFIRQFDFFMGRGPVVSGENLSRISGRVRSLSGVGLSPSVPAGASRRPIRRGDLMVVDIPTHYQGYHADQSRTYSVGEPSAWARDVHRALRVTADQVAGMMHPGVECKEVYVAALQAATDLGLGPDFMRIGRERTQVDFVGHGVGLEVNEPPLLGPRGRNTLKEGMVVALELVITRSQTEVVKLEDMLLVTSQGAEFLTITPRELFEL
jgi:Xaa-Pro aminopeptidase